MVKRVIPVFIFLLIVIIGNKFWDFYDRESSKFEDPVVDQPKTLESTLSIENDSIQPDLALAPEADLWENALELTMLGNSPVLQDLTLGFSSAGAMREFINAAGRNGIEIIDRVDSLNTVRFAVTDLGKASRYFDEFEDDVEPQYNFRVRTPELPGPEFLEGEKNFGAHADKWMGTPEERRDWGSGVKVAILDSGIDQSHSNLNGVSIEEIDLLGGVMSSPGHGTAIASIIAGNDSGISGIAPSASLLSIRVLDGEGQGDSFTVAKGIVEAVDRGAKIINLSLGGSGGSAVLKNAVEYAHEQGSVIVAAVGNEGGNGVSYPAKFENVIGVTSVDANGRQSSFANYGEGVDIAAPGVGVYAAWEDESLVAFSGTSSSTAFVSGALASEISRNPHLSNEEVVDLLYQYSNESEKPGFDEFTGNGILNVGRIENRNVPNLHDGAIVGYYFDPEEMKGGTTPFLVSIQNQGTAWLNNVSLEVKYRGVVKNYIFNNLNPGETRSEKLFLDGSENSGKGVRISSRLRLGGQSDINPDNNARVSTISLPN
jgi:thermitase